MPTKDDVERARREGFTEGFTGGKNEAERRAEEEGDWPLSVVNILRLIDGLTARDITHSEREQIVLAWINARVRHETKDDVP